jgi:hypothetical protein
MTKEMAAHIFRGFVVGFATSKKNIHTETRFVPKNKKQRGCK